MGPVWPWLVLELWPLAFCGGTLLRDPESEKVLPPTNVKIKTYNFNTSLHWDYQDMSPKPLFTVEIQCYGDKDSKVSSCVNISRHYCDLTHNINKNCTTRMWAKVKALVGSRESKHMETSFNPIRDAQIGPPKFNISVEDDNIVVDIEHPLTPYGWKYPLSVRANLSDFFYTVFYWEKKNPQKGKTVEADDCDIHMCFVYLDVPLNTSYCVSVQGISEKFSVVGEKSNESCIFLPSKQPTVLRIFPIIAGVLCAILVVSAVILACWWAKRKHIPLPKSLVSIVRNIKPVNSFDTNTDGKYSAVSSLTYKPVCEDGRSIERIDPITKVETSEPSDSAKITESEAIQEATDEEICESGQSPEASDMYFKSTSGQEEMCTSLPDGDIPRVDVQQPTDLGARRNVSGYDKPHWISSDTNGESLIIV